MISLSWTIIDGDAALPLGGLVSLPYAVQWGKG